MATLLLFSVVDRQVRRQDVGRTVLQCLHGLHSIDAALSNFHSIISKPSKSAVLASTAIGMFDAHVGDCACHMRAQMLWDIIEHFRSSERLIDFIVSAIALLKKIKVKTAILLQLITKKNGNIRPLGFGAVVTTLDIFNHIGFTEFLAFVTRWSNEQLRSNLPISDTETPYNMCRSSTITPEIECERLSSRNNTPSTGNSNITPLSTSSRRHRTLSVDTEWDVNDLPMIIRFLTFCRLMSISKVAALEPGPQTRIIARIDAQYAYTKNEEELDALELVGGVQLHDLIRPADRVKRNTLVNESEAMQVYLAQLTTDWIGKSAVVAGFSTTAQRLCAGFAMTSTRQISCTSAYLSIQPIHAMWLTKGVPIILVIQRFCSYGYHDIFVRVIANNTSPRTQEDFESLGNKNRFDIIPVTQEEIVSSAWANTPHVILICVSENGSIVDFYNRLVDNNQEKLGCNKPHVGPCHEQDEYVRSLPGINFSSILMHFFAQHEQFPFVLPDKRDGHEYVEELLVSELGEEAGKMFVKGRNEAESLGTGRSAKLFSFQHIYLEYPGVVAKQVKEMVDRKDKPARNLCRIPMNMCKIMA